MEIRFRQKMKGAITCDPHIALDCGAFRDRLEAMLTAIVGERKIARETKGVDRVPAAIRYRAAVTQPFFGGAFECEIEVRDADRQFWIARAKSAVPETAVARSLDCLRDVLETAELRRVV